MDNEKRFKLAHISDDDRIRFQGQEHPLLMASSMGWLYPSVGREALEALDVGETLIDQDGDTWERIA